MNHTLELLSALEEFDNCLVDEYADEIASDGFDTLQSFLNAGLNEHDWRTSYSIHMMDVLRKKYEKVTYAAIAKAKG